MAVINFAHREITAKVVYFGATGAGCNTNVRRLHELLPEPDARSRLHKFGPGDTEERSWYFDVRVPEAIAGFSMRYRLYSMPGGLALPAHRREVMDQVDAIVLVVDARPGAGPENERALLELEGLLTEQGLELAALPVVLQVNHTDHPEAREPAAAVFDLNPYGFPVLAACAKEGAGVRETFAEIAAATLAQVRDNLAGGDGAITLTAVHSPQVEGDGDIIRKHLDAIQEESATALSSSLDEVPLPAGTPPGDEIHVPFQPRAFTGTHPVRVVEAAIEDGEVFVDIELEPMGGGPSRHLRVRLANRPTDATAVPRAPSVSTSSSPVMRVTEGLPDKVELHGYPATPDLPPVWYGLLGVTGGLAAGVMLGFLIFT